MFKLFTILTFLSDISTKHLQPILFLFILTLEFEFWKAIFNWKHVDSVGIWW